MNRIDDDGLNELFDIVVEETSDNSEIEQVQEEEPIVQSEDNEEHFIDNEMKKLLKTSNRLMDTAQSLLEAAPDPDTVSAASSMISSISHLLSEFNKTRLIEKRHQNAYELEEMKISARRDLAEFKAQQKSLDAGSGNTYIQQNSISMSQEELVDMLREQSKDILSNGDARLLDVDEIEE